MSRARAIAAILLGTLLCQFALAVPALAMARILAARCCDADCPERPSAGTADRCCAISTAPAGNAAEPSSAPASSFEAAAVILAAPEFRPIPTSASLASPASTARAAPLFLFQQTLQL